MTVPAFDSGHAAPQKTRGTPEFVEPQLARLVERAPSGDGRVHEAEIDGDRMQPRSPHA